MLTRKNMIGLATLGVTLLACVAALNAESRVALQPASSISKATYSSTVTASSRVIAPAMAEVKNVSLSLKADGCETTQPAPCKTYKPCVSYRGCCDCCGPKASQTLLVKDPCDCCCNPCLAEIPVCLPACCKNPCVNCRCGLFGRGIVTYSYDCGCCVTIVFTRCGDVIVRYS